MAKVLIGQDLGSVAAFNASTSTITVTGVVLKTKGIQLIVNATTGQIIYNFADLVGTLTVTDTSVSNLPICTIGFSFSNSGMNNTDVIQIYYYHEDAQEMMLKDLSMAIRTILLQTSRPIWTNGAGSVRVDIATGSGLSGMTLNQVTTVSTVSNVNNVNMFSNHSAGFVGDAIVKNTWANTVRNKIM